MLCRFSCFAKSDILCVCILQSMRGCALKLILVRVAVQSAISKQTVRGRNPCKFRFDIAKMRLITLAGVVS